MRTVQRLCAGCVLVVALALPAHAGHIPCGVAATPPPTPQTAEATPPATGDEAGGVEFVLTILQGVLSVF